jgi:hypothetical protein
MLSPTEKGARFRTQCVDFLRRTAGKSAIVLPETDLLIGREELGASGIWHPDIFIYKALAPLASSASGSVELPWASSPWGLVECKKTSPGRKGGGTLDRNLAQGYMELNDLRLKDKSRRLFLFVSRLSEPGETRRDYRQIFAKIGVRLVNFEDSRDLAEFGPYLLNELAT